MQHLSSTVGLDKADTLPYNNYQLRWSGGGGAIWLFKNQDSIFHSAHCYIDDDFICFDEHNKLSYLLFSTPQINTKVDFLSNTLCSEYSVFLPKQSFSSVKKTIVRDFQAKKNRLVCLTEEDISYSKLRQISLHQDFHLLFQAEKYCGYILTHPLSYLSEHYFSKNDPTPPDLEELETISQFMQTMSDNRLEELENDISLLALELKEKFKNNILSIKNEHRRNLMIKHINDFIDFYIENT